MKTTYKFKNRMFKISAKAVGERLSELYQKNGFITRKIVLDDAKDNDSPIHLGFDWNDKVAAENWRLEQAGQLIRNLIITVEKPDDKGETKKVEVRVFHNIRDDNNPYNKESNSRYIIVNDIMNDPHASDYLLQKAFSDMVAYREKYSNLNELKPHIHLIDKIIDDLKVKEKMVA